MIKRLSFYIVFFVSSFNLQSQEIKLCKQYSEHFKKSFEIQQKSLYQNRKIDVTFYRLNLNINAEENYIKGEVTAYFKTTDSLNKIVFDLSNHLLVDSIYFQNHFQSSFIHANNLVEVKLSQALSANAYDSIRIKYSGIPKSAGFGSFVQDSYNGQDSIIWTLSQPYGAMEWWPCQNHLYDKADSVELIISVPLNQTAAANGVLKKIDTINNYRRFHWKTNYPIATYLIAVSVTNYELVEETYQLNNRNLLMQHFMYPGDSLSLKRSKSSTLPFLQFFDSLFGEYPFIKEKYGHASFTFSGGMEHQTLSFMGGYGGELISHELAHQWFGNKVTCGSWKDLWLNEGFATYLTLLTYEFGVVHNPFYYDVYLNGIRQAAFNHPNESIYRYDTSTVEGLFNQLTYQKGAAALHMLRWIVGDSAFFQGIRNYLNDPSLAYSFVKTEDLKRHLEKSSGINLNEFFKDWIYGKGFPTYTFIWSQSNNQLRIKVLQNQSDPSVYFFNIPLPVQLIGKKIDTTIIINPRFSGDQFIINIDETINSIVFDPQKWILAESEVVIGLQENNSDEYQVNLYPNPTTNQITINTTYPKKFNTLQVIDIKGRVVLESNFNTVIDVHSLSPGKYFLYLLNDEKKLIKSFIKN